MSDSPYIVQKVEWYQLRAPDGTALFVMVSSLPNGFFTAVPCKLSIELANHTMIALAATQDDALAQLQTTLADKTQEQIFAHD